MASYPALKSNPLELVASLDDGCISPLGGFLQQDQEVAQCFLTLLNDSLEHKVLINLPKRIIDWGSNGRAGAPWHFRNSSCNQLFIKHFMHLNSVRSLHLSPHDLFHGHLITYTEGHKLSLGIVFHAKEYPRDLEAIKNNYQVLEETFTTNSSAFSERNFIYLIHGEDHDAFSSVVHDLYLIKNQGKCQSLFLYGNSVSEMKFAEVTGGRFIGDVNLFFPHTINRIKYNFYPGYIGSVLYIDLEEIHSGRTVSERLLANEMLDETILRYQGNPIIYFLTGLQASR
jgi:hypothetical protein